MVYFTMMDASGVVTGGAEGAIAPSIIEISINKRGQKVGFAPSKNDKK